MGLKQPKTRISACGRYAEASQFVADLPHDVYTANTEPMLSHINLGSSPDIPILELAQMVSRITGIQGSIATDPSKPDGTSRKLMDVGRLSNMSWRARIGLQDGIEDAYRWYLANRDTTRS